jgi:hypothetical protein
VPIGKLPVTRAEKRMSCGSFGGWDRWQRLLQWRWDHEREAVLAEDERERLQAESATEANRIAYLPISRQSLEELRTQTPFAGWAGHVESADLRHSRRIIRDLIDELLALGPDGDEVEKLDLLRRCVERFNAAEENGGFIDTIEREDICEVLDKIAEAAGLTDYDVSAARDW